MTLRYLLLFFICFLSSVADAQPQRGSNPANPTGTYKNRLNSMEEKKFFYGKIEIKQIRQNRIVVRLIVVNGGISNRSGELMDTLTYRNHFAIFKNSETDSTCKITFQFTAKGIQVKQKSTRKNMNCGFADGVRADGFYIKESSKVPDFHNPY